MAERNVTVTVDPSVQIRRHLQGRERESGWEVFKAIYWGIYSFALGLMLLLAVPRMLDITGFIGWALILLSMFVVVYGLVISLHLRLMRKHG
jgi:hypothetical protein